MKNRIARINELLKEELSKIILRDIDIDKDILLTIVSVDTSPDLRYSKVSIGILPDSKSGTGLRVLNKNIFKIQQALNKDLSMKPVPRIHFELYQGGKYYSKIEKIIEEIESQENNSQKPL